MQSVLSFFFAFFLLCQSCLAADYVTGKHIWIWQKAQIGEAVEDGELIFTFKIISGRTGRYATPEGDFRIYEKKGWGYTNHEGVDMPFAMFFFRRYALHGWSRSEPFPKDEERPWLASHGCVSIETIERLYNWAPIGTPVHVHDERTDYN